MFLFIYCTPTCAKTQQDPADIPKRVTDAGSPPKCSIFCWTHWRAATWSRKAQFPRACSSPVLEGNSRATAQEQQQNTTKATSAICILCELPHSALTYSPSHLRPWLPCAVGSLALTLPEFLLYTPEDASKGQNKHCIQHQISPAGCNHMTMPMECTDISRGSEVLMSVNDVHLNGCNSGKLIEKFSRFSRQKHPCFKHDSKYFVKSDIGDLTWRIPGVPVCTELLPPQHSRRLPGQSHHTEQHHQI